MWERATVAVLSQGCKLNQADAEAIVRRLAGEGVRAVQRLEKGADGYVINSCSVTHVADGKARHLTRLARRLSPKATIVLTGCYAETAPANVAELTGADIVVRSAEKADIPALLIERLRLRGDPAAGCPDPAREGLRTRAFVKIQEGCDEMCAFCIVPRTRGRERSVPIEEVVREVRAREREGVLEVVLTGTQLGNYGRDLGRAEQGPRRLLEALLEGTNVPRIHLSSLQAQDIRPELVALWRDGRLNPHFHLPLQSGADGVLRRMRRRYTVAQFREAVSRIRSAVPEVSITTDVIAGFPGETEADFEATVSLCEELGFAAMHAFPYSRRPGTGAQLMRDQVPVEVRRSRLERLLTIAEASSRTHRRRYVGRVMPVLWEEERLGRWRGLTPNYLRVFAEAEGDLTNALLPTLLVSVTDDGMAGELAPAGERAA
jgi:threonylcarbamoyladenosine tRNA methylthiotransferase MtaB